MMITDLKLKEALQLPTDLEKLEAISKIISEQFDDLDAKDFIKLLEPCVDITQRMYEANPALDSLSEYTFAMTKLSEYLIQEEMTWKATPLLESTERLLEGESDNQELFEWKYNTWYQIGNCFYTAQRRKQAKTALQQARHYAEILQKDTADCDYLLDKVENPMLKYDPVEDSEKYLAVIDEVEKKLYEQLKNEHRGMGFCFCYWSTKADILAEYGIEWRSPGVMNPRVHFD